MKTDMSPLAISTLLTQPITRTGLLPYTSGQATPKAPSTRDIPPVTLSNIPSVDANAFKPYIKQAGSLYDALRRAKEDGDEGGSHLFRRNRTSSKTDHLSDLINHGLQRRQSSISNTQKLDVPSSAPGSPVEAHQLNRRTSGGPTRRVGLPVTPLSTIPSVYFEEDFHLENPRTFDIVSERSEIVRPPSANGSVVAPRSSGRKALATNAILQEKLSWYMDTVEIHLISSISTASTSFFAALGSLRELHSEAADSVTKIRVLREDLRRLDENMAIGGLKIVAMRRRRENMRKLSSAVNQLQQVVQAVTQCDKQVDNGQIEEALQGLANVEALIAGEPLAETSKTTDLGSSHFQKSLVDLRGIKALEGADNDIAFLRRRIGKGFESRFVEALLGDLRKHVDSVPSSMTLQRWDKASQRSRGHHVRSPSVFPAYLHLDDALRADLLQNLRGLAHTECVMPATVAYREAVLREMKGLIRRHLPSSSDEDAESTMSASTTGARRMTQQEKSSILAQNLRALDSEDAEVMLKKIYSNVGEALRRLGTQVKVLLDLTSGLSTTEPRSASLSPRSPQLALNGIINTLSTPPIPQEDIQQALDLSNLLGQAVDIAQTQITKILKVRSEQSVHLELSSFLKYFNLNRLFADECEAVSGRGGQILKTVVNSHIKDFVAQFGATERQQLIQRMDNDRWDAKDFTDADAQILDRVLESSTQDAEIWTKDFSIWGDPKVALNGQPLPNGIASNGISATQDTSNGDTPSKDKVRPAAINEQKYILALSPLTLLTGIGSFQHLIAGIPSMTYEITVILLDYLKLFNSRSSQLILGAGATRSAGLKNITTKHLALASQALSFVIVLIPHIREFVRRHSASGSHLMIEFDKVKRLYQEHQSGINDKLVDIMSGRATMHVNEMKKIDWDNGGSNQAVNGYMETLVRETLMLHKVLIKHLPEPTVAQIMDPVFESYKEQFGNAFKGGEIKIQNGKDR